MSMTYSVTDNSCIIMIRYEFFDDMMGEDEFAECSCGTLDSKNDLVATANTLASLMSSSWP